MKLGIAYSGDTQETGDLIQKLEHAINNDVAHIQIRFKDIIDYIATDHIDYEKWAEFKKLVIEYSGTISIHLPSPKWKGTSLIGLSKGIKTEAIFDFIQKQLLPLGITLYTVHPYFDKNTFDALNEAEKEGVIKNLANLFAILAQTGAVVAIENMPCKDPDFKSCSFGMELDDISQIIAQTRDAYQLAGGTKAASLDHIGMTLDTGHATMLEHNLQEKEELLASWIGLYYDDIMCVHFSPAIHQDLELQTGKQHTVIDYDRDIFMMRVLFEQLSMHNVEVPIYTEAHASLNTLGELYEISKLYDKISKHR